MLSRRERIIGTAAILIIAVFVADRFILTPITERLRQLDAQKNQRLAEVNEAHSLFERRRLMEKKWQKLLTDGLKSESEVESLVLHSIGSWARQSQLTLTSLKPQRPSTVTKGLQEMVFSVAGSGRLEAVTRFLWHLENTTLALRIEDMQLGSSNDTGELMSLQLRLSALYVGTTEQQSEGENDRDS